MACLVAGFDIELRGYVPETMIETHKGFLLDMLGEVVLARHARAFHD